METPNKRVEEFKKLHEHIRDRIERINSTYSAQANKHRKRKMFQLGDLVWVHLRKVSATFNVSDLSPYEDDDNLSNLKSSFAKQGRTMEGHHGHATMTKTKAQEVRTTGRLCWNKPTRGKVQLGPKLSPVLYFQFASLLASKWLIFLHGFEVLEVN